MSSIIPSYEYDVFISYRHNDNRSGWVSDFVSALKEELAATIKEPVSVYFDKNLWDGLLETHQVQLSVQEKIKCLIFIPILSRTYCDPDCFAWKNEFCAFNALSKQDPFGRDVKLSNGNVASRILPIKIHDLDTEDLTRIESEIGGALRAIDFVYKEPGVNRPLKGDDKKLDNLNRTTYQNQVNKVANAVKDLLYGLRSPRGEQIVKRPELNYLRHKVKSRLGLISALVLAIGTSAFGLYSFVDLRDIFDSRERSIAVLPFENISGDSEQDYFSSGMTQDILNHLCKIGDLEVKSRTSTLQYKNSHKRASQIGNELEVAHILVGSVRKVGDKVRIAVQLIDTKEDIHLWSETYDRDLSDILKVQDEIAIEIANTLEARLSKEEKINIQKDQTLDITAYDYYLKAREELSTIKFTKAELNRLKGLVDQAIEKDPNFVKAYALKSRLWFNYTTFGVPEEVWRDSAIQNAQKAIAIDSTSAEGYWALAQVQWHLGRMDSYERNIQKAYWLNPNDIDVKISYAVYLLDNGKEQGADLALRSIRENYNSKQPEFNQLMFHAYYRAGDYLTALKFAERLAQLNPNSINGFFWANLVYNEMNEFDKAEAEMAKYIKTDPKEIAIFYDACAWTAFRKGDYVNASVYWSKYKEVESTFEDKEQTIPFRHRLAMALLKLGRDNEAKRLLEEELQIQTDMLRKVRSTGAWAHRGGMFYDLAVCQALLGKNEAAIQNLDSAFRYRFAYKRFYKNDPALSKLTDDPAFKNVQAKVDAYFEFRKQAFANAIERARLNDELKSLLDR